MSEANELLEAEASAAAVAKPATKPAAKKAEKVVSGWPKYLKSTTNFGYTDPVTGIRYKPNVPVRIDAAPAEHSWLDSQMKAGYIGEA